LQSFALKPIENNRAKTLDGAKTMAKPKVAIGFEFDNSLASEVNAEIKKDIEKRQL
jgi:hypothetical protein